MLALRDGSGERRRAGEFLAEARSAYLELGMCRHVARVERMEAELQERGGG